MSMELRRWASATPLGAVVVPLSLCVLLLCGCEGAENGSGNGADRPPPSPQPSPEPTVSLSANPTTIEPGQSTTLTWTSTNATEVLDSNFGAGPSEVSGSTVVSPASSTRYDITVRGAGGHASASVNVTVSSAAPPSEYWLYLNEERFRSAGAGWCAQTTVSFGGDLWTNSYCNRSDLYWAIDSTWWDLAALDTPQRFEAVFGIEAGASPETTYEIEVWANSLERPSTRLFSERVDLGQTYGSQVCSVDLAARGAYRLEIRYSRVAGRGYAVMIEPRIWGTSGHIPEPAPTPAGVYLRDFSHQGRGWASHSALSARGRTWTHSHRNRGDQYWAIDSATWDLAAIPVANRNRFVATFAIETLATRDTAYQIEVWGTGDHGQVFLAQGNVDMDEEHGQWDCDIDLTGERIWSIEVRYTRLRGTGYVLMLHPRIV